MALAPEEARKIKSLVTGFLEATHGVWSVSRVDLKSVKKQEDKIEIKGEFDSGGIIEAKIVPFTIVLDAKYRLVSYERT